MRTLFQKIKHSLSKIQQFKLNLSKSLLLVILVAEMFLINFIYHFPGIFSIFDYQVVPVIYVFAMTFLFKRDLILKMDNFRFRLGEDNDNFFYLSIIVISCFLVHILRVPLFVGAMEMTPLNSVLLSLVFAPICEELVFRHYLMNRFISIYGDSRKGIIIALVISSLFFSVGHAYQGFFGVVSIFFKGLIFGSVYLLFKRSIAASTATHFLNNVIAVLG